MPTHKNLFVIPRSGRCKLKTLRSAGQPPGSVLLAANAEAIYELALAYSTKGDYQRSLDLATTGTEYDSPFLSGFYLILGSDLDELGKTRDAIDVYK